MSKSQIRILIVDDDLVDRMACRRALLKNDHNHDYVVSEAETAREGLQLAHSQKPDCVLLDYHLPDLNGLEFLAALRNDLGEITVPVMMLTGTDDVSVAVEAMKSGAQDYLIKDTNRQYLELLPAVIERVLRERWAVMEKKQIEARMGEAEAKYRFLVEQIPAISYTASLDTPGKLLYVSPQLRQLGYSPEEWITTVGALRSHVHPEDKARAAEALDRVRADGKPLRCEYRVLNSAGEARWFLDEATLVRDESGEPLFLQGILVDITEDKQVEEELRLHRHYVGDIVTMRTSQLEKQAAVLQSANASLSAELRALRQSEGALKRYADRLADLYNGAPCGFHSLDPNGVFVQINDTELKWHGLAREKVMGRIKFADLLTPESGKTFQESYAQFKESGWIIRNLELEIARKEGGNLTVLLNANAILDAEDHFAMSRSILVDITGLKHA
jgi:PAS domain S-box-containing protein